MHTWYMSLTRQGISTTYILLLHVYNIFDELGSQYKLHYCLFLLFEGAIVTLKVRRQYFTRAVLCISWSRTIVIVRETALIKLGWSIDCCTESKRRQIKLFPFHVSFFLFIFLGRFLLRLNRSLSYYMSYVVLYKRRHVGYVYKK